jgi:dynein intermediate chain 2
MEIVYVYTKKRADFGRQCHFTDRQITSKEMHIAPDEELTAHFIDKNPCYRATQNAPDMSEHEINTVRFERETRGMNHLEGGWPKDVNPSEVEQTIRYRKKVEKDERYIQTVVRLGEVTIKTKSLI